MKKYTLKWWYLKWKIEKGFMKELSKNLRKDWYFVYHIQDIWAASRMLDMYCIKPNWESLWIECKKIIGSTFNISQFEFNQIELLTFMDEVNPELALVAIYSQKHNDYVMFRFKDLIKMKNEKWWIKVFK